MKMCETCNGTGGINIEHSWGLQAFPCSNLDCVVNIQEREELIKYIDKMLLELRGRESA